MFFITKSSVLGLSRFKNIYFIHQEKKITFFAHMSSIISSVVQEHIIMIEIDIKRVKPPFWIEYRAIFGVGKHYSS